MINTVRNSLRDNLVDPYTLMIPAGQARSGNTWIFADEPITIYKYPMVQLKKVDNPSTVLTIGSNYWEEEEIFINIWYYVKNGQSIRVSGTTYKNAQLVEYYLGQIKTTLKAQFNTLFDAGVKGYKHLNTTIVDYDPATQLYFGAVTIRVRFFTT